MKIADIIKNRQDFAKTVLQKIQKIKSIRPALEACSSALASVLRIGNLPDGTETSAERFQEEIKEFCDQRINQCVELLDQLRKRFDKETYTIGVVGNARQGKSKLLQRITGLTDAEIPTAVTGFCTGAPSLIISDTETFANVKYYTEKELFDEVIVPFFMKLRLKPQPGSFDSFISEPLPGPLSDYGATETAFYEELKKRHDQVDAYRAYLTGESGRIRRSQIMETVAQHDGKEYPEVRTHFSKWIAVKMAEIHCPFKIDGDLDGLAVCDSPGLGDFICGAEENLMRNIADNVDIVVMLKRTPNGGTATTEDTELFDFVNNTVQELGPEEWIYHIHNNGENQAEVKKYDELIKQAIRCRGYFSFNVRDVDDKTVICCFRDIINGVGTTQQGIDLRIFKARMEEIEVTLREMENLASRLSAFIMPVNDDIGVNDAQSRFRGTIWEKLKAQLSNLVDEYQQTKDAPCESFMAKLDAIQTALLKSPGDGLAIKWPTAEQFKLHRQQQAVFTSECQRIRRHIINSFDSLDETEGGLHKLFDAMKSKVMDCFTSEEYGRCGNISFLQDPETWWDSLADNVEQITRIDAIATQIARALRLFGQTTLSFRSFLLPRVLSCFDVLDPDSKSHAAFQYTAGCDPETCIERIKAAAESGIDTAVKACKSIAKEPSVALFAAIEDIYESVTLTGGTNRVEHIWANFYSNCREEIWEDYRSRKNDRELYENWHKSITLLLEKIFAVKTAG